VRLTQTTREFGFGITEGSPCIPVMKIGSRVSPIMIKATRIAPMYEVVGDLDGMTKGVMV